ncbi:S8 family peptidase [Salinimicrobium soli]|uniref:S8 family peptidase n=1 Tax=Salinimicrobium soli TaxID=1254399 RepID=UPI003AAFB660
MKFLKNYSVLALSVAMATAVSCSKDDSGVNDTISTTPEVAQASSDIIPDQYIVVFKAPGKTSGDHRMNKQAVQQKTVDVFAQNGLQGAEVLKVYSAALSGAVVKMSKDQAALLRNSNEVAYVEPDRIISLGKPSWAGGGDTGSTGQETPYGITNVNGGGASYTGNGVVWVIDSGIDLDHPDLNVETSPELAFSAFTKGKDAGFDDGNGHGTHVAGTIAALDNDFGVIGVAPGAKVVPVKVLDSRGSGSYSGVIDGVNHVAAHGKAGDVANMSLGGPVSVALDDAVKAAAATGVKFALAAGNETDDANNHSPARANHANIYTISAVDSQYRFASFSNYGNPPVDYAAPGVAIKSTWKDGGYNTISGTSMASPHAAGVLLLGAPKTSAQTISGDPDGNVDPFITH